jgi:hypothetical protein
MGLQRWSWGYNDGYDVTALEKAMVLGLQRWSWGYSDGHGVTTVVMGLQRWAWAYNDGHGVTTMGMGLQRWSWGYSDRGGYGRDGVGRKDVGRGSRWGKSDGHCVYRGKGMGDVSRTGRKKKRSRVAYLQITVHVQYNPTRYRKVDTRRHITHSQTKANVEIEMNEDRR